MKQLVRENVVIAPEEERRRRRLREFGEEVEPGQVGGKRPVEKRLRIGRRERNENIEDLGWELRGVS
jgi:hypothetical protein